MNFGIYKTFTFHVNMPKDPLSSPLLGIYFTFAFKSKGLKDRLLWFEAVLVKRLYLRLYYWDLDILYTK